MAFQSDATAPTPTSHFVDAIPNDSVVYISQPKETFNSVWGGLMNTTAQVLGAQGVVVAGLFRDIHEHRDLNFPLFVQGLSIVGSSTFTRTPAINKPLEFTSPSQKSPMVIKPGDIILGNADGVVVIPAALVEPCLKFCEERLEMDTKTSECLVNVEEFGPTIARLRKYISSIT